MLEIDPKELEFQEFIGSKVTILSETRKGVKRNLTLRELRQRAEAGEEFRFDKGNACACLNPLPDGSMDNTCNCLHLPYSDGASFAGYRAEPWAVPEGPDVPAGSQVFFRGIRNFDGVLDFAMSHGMAEATELVVTGGSAGGLSTFLHADRAAARVPNAKARAAPVVGYFLDHDNFKHTTGGKPNTPEWSTPGTGANYTTWMRYVYRMQNMTFGSDGGLTEACRQNHPQEPGYAALDGLAE